MKTEAAYYCPSRRPRSRATRASRPATVCNEKGFAYLRAAHPPKKRYRNGSACLVEAAQPAKGARPGIEVD